MPVRLSSGQGYTEHKGVCEVSETIAVHAKPLTAWQRVQMAVSFTVIGGAMVYVGVHMTNHKDCAPIDVAYETTALTDREIDSLVEQGYFGAPNDGKDALYAPGCEDEAGIVVRTVAEDGTVTLNYVPEGGEPVVGMVILPDGTTHTFDEMDDAAAEGRDNADEGTN